MPKLPRVSVPGGEALPPPAIHEPPADPGTARLAVLRREAVPDLSCLPAAVVDYFKARGYVTTLASMHEANAMQLSVNERFPLCLDDIADPDERETLRKALVRQSFRIKEGFPQRGDCWIYVQPVEARAAQLRQGLANWLRQDDPASVDPMLTEINQLFRGSNLSETSANARDVGRLSDHVAPWEE